MRTSFTTSQIARIVRLTSPKFNVRINKCGNLAIEPTPMYANSITSRFVVYKVANGYVVRKGSMNDLKQKRFSRLVKHMGKDYMCTFPTFNEAFAVLKQTMERNELRENVAA